MEVRHPESVRQRGPMSVGEDERARERDWFGQDGAPAPGPLARRFADLTRTLLDATPTVGGVLELVVARRGRDRPGRRPGQRHPARPGRAVPHPGRDRPGRRTSSTSCSTTTAKAPASSRPARTARPRLVPGPRRRPALAVVRPGRRPPRLPLGTGHGPAPGRPPAAALRRAQHLLAHPGRSTPGRSTSRCC